MIKGLFELTTVEMFAIKHALQHQVKYKQEKLQALKETTLNNANIDLYVRLKKDVAHETELVNRLEAEIKRCKPIVRV